MKADKITAYIYAAVSVLAVLCVQVTNTNYRHIAYGLAYVWICYFCFWIGSHAAGKTNMMESVVHVQNERFLPGKHLYFVMVFAVIGMILVARFYTGQTPWSIVSDLYHHRSLYMVYQSYYNEMSLGRMSLTKIPYILINASVQFLLVYCYIYFMIIKKKIEMKEAGCLIALTCAKLYLGIARGTNFEMFEIAFLFIYCYLSGSGVGIKRVKKLALAVISILGCCAVFMVVIGLRGAHGTSVVISEGIVTDSSKELTAQYPQLAMIIAYLSAYFCFGIYFLSYFFDHFFAEDIFYFVNGIIPCGYLAGGIEVPEISNTDFLKSVCWKPDLIRLIYLCGVLATPVVFAVMGRMIRRIRKIKDIYREDIYINMLEYFIVYQMFSFPIGNFILVTSASRLAVLLLVIILVSRRKIKMV